MPRSSDSQFGLAPGAATVWGHAPGGGLLVDGAPVARRRPPGAAVAQRWRSASPAERAVAVAAVALCVPWSGRLGLGAWATESAVAVLVGLAGLPALVRRAARSHGRPAGERLAARALLGWLAVGLVAVAGAARPALAMVGMYQVSTGWIFMAVLAGSFGLGTLVGPTGRRLLMDALLAGVLANAVVAVLQLLVGLGAIGLPRYGDGQALGFTGNPVFLGGLEAAGVVVLAAGLRRAGGRTATWAALLLASVGVAAAGERLSMGLAAVVACWAVGWSLWEHRRGQPGGARVRGAAVAAVVAGGMALGALLPMVRGGMEVGTKLSATAQGTFGDRLHAWLAGAHALAQHPLVGAGPGQFYAATARYFPLWFARSHGGQVFTDGHDIFVEYAVTTGLLGVGLLVTALAATLRGRGGTLLAFALAMLVVSLVEPLNPAYTPLAFLALGAAAGRRQQARAPGGARSPGTHDAGRGLRIATVAAATIGLALAADLVVGSLAMAAAEQQRLVANLPAATADANLANHLLAPWPQPADEMALVQMLGRQTSAGAPLPLAVALRWQQIAAGRDPADTPSWDMAAQLALRLGRFGTATSDARTVLRVAPWDTAALQVLGSVALDRHDPAAARRWYERLVAVRPRPDLAALMAGACRGGPTAPSLTVLRRGACS